MNQVKKHFKTSWLVLLAFIFAALFLLLASRAVSGWLKSSAEADDTGALRQNERGNFIKKKIFGYSGKGKAIEGYEIGFGENAALLFGAIHGNEMGTAGLLRQLALEIALNPALVPQNNKLIIIPVANPDGYYDRTDNLNANEVNLNLNFATSDWQEYGPEGNYAGPRPFSESESQAIRRVVEQYDPRVMISFHSHGNLVSPETAASSVALAKWYADKTGYAYYDAWDYPGTATKWFEETTGNPAITVELPKDLQSDWEINKGALLELIMSENLLPI